MKQKQKYESEMKDPPAEFVAWWAPISKDRDSGADAGGHPEAERVWARKDPGRWVHHTYGTSARVAWNTAIFHEEYLTWIEIGRPEKEPFVGIAAPTVKQKEFWQRFKSVLGKVSKPMPEPQPLDYDLSSVGNPS